MRGRVIFINPANGTGLIFGADRKRYNFMLNDWHEQRPPPRNLEVMFDIKGESAQRVRPFTFDGDVPLAYNPEEAIAQAEARLDDSGDGTVKARRAPIVEPATQKPIIDELPGGEEIQIPLTGGTLGEGRMTPESKASRRLAKSVLLDDDTSKPRRPAWQYYVMGLIAALVFILIAYLTRHLFPNPPP